MQSGEDIQIGDTDHVNATLFCVGEQLTTPAAYASSKRGGRKTVAMFNMITENDAHSATR